MVIVERDASLALVPIDAVGFDIRNIGRSNKRHADAVWRDAVEETGRERAGVGRRGGYLDYLDDRDVIGMPLVVDGSLFRNGPCTAVHRHHEGIVVYGGKRRPLDQEDISPERLHAHVTDRNAAERGAERESKQRSHIIYPGTGSLS